MFVAVSGVAGKLGPFSGGRPGVVVGPLFNSGFAGSVAGINGLFGGVPIGVAGEFGSVGGVIGGVRGIVPVPGAIPVDADPKPLTRRTPQNGQFAGGCE